MKNVNRNEQVLVNGGALHYHWKCSTHGYNSVARTAGSAKAWANWHNNKYYKGTKKATTFSCSKSCGTIRSNYPA